MRMRYWSGIQWVYAVLVVARFAAVLPMLVLSLAQGFWVSALIFGGFAVVFGRAVVALVQER